MLTTIAIGLLQFIVYPGVNEGQSPALTCMFSVKLYKKGKTLYFTCLPRILSERICTKFSLEGPFADIILHCVPKNM